MSSLYEVGRIIFSWAAQSLVLIAMSFVVPGLHVRSWQAALAAVAIISLLNAVLWPMLSLYALRFLVFTFGIGALLLNAAIIYATSLVVTGFRIEGYNALFLTPIILGLVEVLSYSLPASNDPEGARAKYHAYFRHALDKKHEFDVHSAPNTRPGLVFLEIDGLAKRVLHDAIARGFMPTLAGWINRGSHKVVGWETDLSSQTSSSQAGLLHGNNQDIVAFRWYEKENERLVVSSRLADAAILEKKISNGNGLLSKNGASRGNLFSGDAQNALLTVSRIPKVSRLYTDSWYLFYSNPYSFARTIGFLLWDILLETRSRLRQRIRNIQPRLHRSLEYFLVRAIAVVLMREVTTYTVIGDIAIGQEDVVYASYSGYDEVAHHNGPEDEDAFRILRQLDKTFARIERARKNASRTYQIVVLSDHGQTPGPTFKQASKVSLGELVSKLLPEEFDTQYDHIPPVEHLADMGANPVQATRDSLRKLLRRAPAEVRRPKHSVEQLPKSHALVLASGNLGLVYFTDMKDRLSIEEINDKFPNLIPGLLSNNYIGFVMANSPKYGPLVVGANGTYFLAEDRVEGENPLKHFGPNARTHLLRQNSFQHMPDLLVNSRYDTGKNHVTAFETQVGSHGGLGGDQTKPFLMVPTDWQLDDKPLVGAEKVHQVLKQKVEELSQEQVTRREHEVYA